VADGAYDLTFMLYNAESGDTPLWSEALTGLAVQDGDFTTFLGSTNPLAKEILNGEELWLAVSVRGPSESAFTDLEPRQHLIDPSSASLSSPTAGPTGMTGLYGIGDNYGVQGYGNHGAYFSGYDDNQDLILGGVVGRINANSTANSQLYLSSNADVILKLDNDSGGNNFLRVKNSSGADACTIDEGGNLACAGSKAGYRHRRPAFHSGRARQHV
jgi:hypothetical protein